MGASVAASGDMISVRPECDIGDALDVAGPTREAAMHLARELGLAIAREGGGLRAWPATAGELDALAECKSPAAMGRVRGAVPWWRESDR